MGIFIYIFSYWSLIIFLFIPGYRTLNNFPQILFFLLIPKRTVVLVKGIFNCWVQQSTNQSSTPGTIDGDTMFSGQKNRHQNDSKHGWDGCSAECRCLLTKNQCPKSPALIMLSCWSSLLYDIYLCLTCQLKHTPFISDSSRVVYCEFLSPLRLIAPSGW